VSDIRALLAGRAIEISDGCYVERLDVHESEFEERLRGFMARFSSSGRAKAKGFVQKVNALESSIRAYQDDELRAALANVARQLQKKRLSRRFTGDGFCGDTGSVKAHTGHAPL